MSVNRFIQFSHVIYIFLLLATYHSLADPLNMISATTVGILVFTSIFMMGILAITPEIIEAPMALLNLALLVMFQMRALILIIAPETIHYQRNSVADIADYENAALLLCTGTIMMACGLLVSAALSKREKKTYSENNRPAMLWPQFSPVIIFMGISVIFFPVIIYSFLFEALKFHSGEVRSITTILTKLLPFIFPFEIFFCLAVIVMLDRGWNNLSFFAKLISLSIFVSFLIAQLANGAKSAIILAMLYSLFGVYVVGKKIRLKATTIIFFLPTLIVLVFVGFFAGLFLRLYVTPAGQQSEQVLASQVTDLYKSQIMMQQRQNPALNILARFGSRLTGFDVLVVVSDDKFKGPISECDLLTEAKSFINMTFHPPERFPVPITGQTFGVIYDEAPPEMYIERIIYTTYVWYAWGIFFFHFGPLLGNILLFLATFVMGLAYIVLFQNKVGDTGIYLRLVWFIVFFQFLDTMGFDFSASQAVYYALFGIFDMMVLGVIFRSLASLPAARR